LSCFLVLLIVDHKDGTHFFGFTLFSIFLLQHIPDAYFVVILFFPIFDFCIQERDGYWKMMHKYIGSDVTSMVTLPVIIFEPMTMLQKMAEVCTALFYFVFSALLNCFICLYWHLIEL